MNEKILKKPLGQKGDDVAIVIDKAFSTPPYSIEKIEEAESANKKSNSNG